MPVVDKCPNQRLVEVSSCCSDTLDSKSSDAVLMEGRGWQSLSSSSRSVIGNPRCTPQKL